MSKENISRELILKNIGEATNYLIEETNRNELMSKKHKNVYRVLNYIEHLLVLIFTVTGCVSMCFCFFTSYSYRNDKFCNRIKNLCNNSRNYKV